MLGAVDRLRHRLCYLLVGDDEDFGHLCFLACLEHDVDSRLAFEPLHGSRHGRPTLLRRTNDRLLIGVVELHDERRRRILECQHDANRPSAYAVVLAYFPPRPFDGSYLRLMVCSGHAFLPLYCN